MKSMRCGAVLLMILAWGWSAHAQEAGGKADGAAAREKIAGVWRGNSVCVDKNTPCHDEVNVYRFSPVEGKADTFQVTASKVVDGKEIEMGSSKFKYNEKTKTVESEKPRIRLTILRENWMEGALTLDDGTEYRKIRLKKESGNGTALATKPHTHSGAACSRRSATVLGFGA